MEAGSIGGFWIAIVEGLRSEDNKMLVSFLLWVNIRVSSFQLTMEEALGQVGLRPWVSSLVHPKQFCYQVRLVVGARRHLLYIVSNLTSQGKGKEFCSGQLRPSSVLVAGRVLNSLSITRVHTQKIYMYTHNTYIHIYRHTLYM